MSLSNLVQVESKARIPTLTQHRISLRISEQTLAPGARRRRDCRHGSDIGGDRVGLLRPDISASLTFVSQYGQWIVALGLFWVLMVLLVGGYDLRLSSDPWTVTRRMASASACFAGIYLLVFFLSANQPNSIYDVPFLAGTPLLRVVPILFLGSAIPLEIAWRVGYARLLTKSYFQHRVLIAGAGDAGLKLADAFHEGEALNVYLVLGYVDDDSDKLDQMIAGYPVHGNHDRLVDLVKRFSINEIVIAISHELQGGMFQAIMDSYEQGVQITPMPVMHERLTGRVPVEHVGNHWYVSLPVGATPPSWLYRSASRAIDLALAAAGLCLFTLVAPVVAICNRIWSPGPMLYSQVRVGKGGTLFRVYKFRSMIPDAEKYSGATWASEDDPRVTRIGHFLRRSRLDEIPQFWNVVRGEMSLIGPRPERPEFVNELAEQIPFYRSRHAVKPGLTGWAQVRYRYGASVDDALIKLQYDLYYIKHQSIILDLAILQQTLGVVLGLQGR